METIKFNGGYAMNVAEFISMLKSFPDNTMIYFDGVESEEIRDPLRYEEPQPAPGGVLYNRPAKKLICDCVTYNIRIQSNHYYE